ncbi:MAG TPA: GAF domain-containing protein [Armatimonadetes bacterium]|nr:GAF domain-containing protein [Armatimonadota bacterium]
MPELGTRNASRFAALQEILLAINTSLDLEEVLHGILRHASELLGARHGSIMLLDEDTQELSIFVATGLSEDIIRNTRVRLGEGIAGRVALEGKPRVLRRGERDAHSLEEEEKGEREAAIVVPLRTKDRIVGVLNVSGKVDGNNFTEDDVQLLTLLASQSGVAIENAQLYNEAAERAEELAALHEVGVAITSSLDVEEVLNQVLDRATRLLRARYGSLMLLDGDEETLYIAAASGLPEEVIRETRVRLGEGIAGQVAATGQPRRLDKGVRAAESRSGDERAQRAALSVPLQAKGEIIGVLNVSDRLDGSNFTDTHLRLLTTLASQAAIAINNARLYDSLQERSARLRALNEIGTALTSSLDRDEVLDRVLKYALDLLGAETGSLMLIDPEDLTQMRIVVARGLPKEVVREARVRIGDGIAGSVAANGQPVVLAQGERDVRSQSAAARRTQAALCVPLKVKDRVIGVLNLSGRRQGGNFTAEDLELVVTLASQAATAIENAQLYDDLREQFVQSIRVIANAIDARDPYTRGHSERVTEYALLIARELGLPEGDLEVVRYGGLLHDVGKIGIRDEILLKPGRLTEEEFQIMKSHPVRGADIISPVRQLQRILPALRYHHERYTVDGYPEGLHGEDIPLIARIIGVADTYDAMTTNRPYRKALPREIALQELIRNRGVQFDPQIVDAFLRCVARGEVDHLDGQSGAQELIAEHFRQVAREEPVQAVA